MGSDRVTLFVKAEGLLPPMPGTLLLPPGSGIVPAVLLMATKTRTAMARTTSSTPPKQPSSRNGTCAVCPAVASVSAYRYECEGGETAHPHIHHTHRHHSHSRHHNDFCL